MTEAFANPVVLVVDDEETILEFTKAVLFPAGYHVVTVRDGKAALDLIDEGLKPDIILLDMIMPVMDGPEFIKILRDRNSEIPVAIISGAISPESINPGSPVVDFLSKPFTQERLLSVVVKTLTKGEEHGQEKEGSEGTGSKSE